ncbi:OLC1v1020496C1 [Oldenlandia corymbosa var. corymbosa]|uniref:OLC1v1020496C1 n=1 Tax=Oldenlandia corymbosa var. corymbosa TaxID=529605 RepID=A0AAV1EGQ6_OLDCO|nr:OLC1v1020496C1 [Oldenlandia corymbosa var. corymbosa]
MEAAKIEIISRELIKPSTPTPDEQKELKFSFLDQLQGHAFMPLLLFYQPPQLFDSKDAKVVDPSEATRHLKQSLSESLTKFYPLAGRLNPDDHHLSVDCDDSGALFMEAKVDSSLSEAVQNTSMESFAQYLPFDPFSNQVNLLGAYPIDEILLGVQITWFGCGGSAIGVCLSHKVADLMSLITFMDSWAAINRGDGSSSKSKPINFDAGRHLFPALEFPIPQNRADWKEKYVYKKFLFNKEKIAELKELAICASSSLKDPTRVEVISAFIWKHFINMGRAQRQDGDNKTMFQMWNSMNLRTRISNLASSSLNDEFPFGNLSIVATASFIHDEDTKKTDYGNLVRIVSDSMRKVNEDYVFNCAVPSLKLSAAGVAGLEEMQKPTMKISVRVITSWCRFPIYEVDFGWGKPVSAGPAFGKPPGPVVLLLDTRCDDGIEALIVMLERELAILPNEFLSLATNFF